MTYARLCYDDYPPTFVRPQPGTDVNMLCGLTTVPTRSAGVKIDGWGLGLGQDVDFINGKCESQ
jgi:hypothetical protein